MSVRLIMIFFLTITCTLVYSPGLGGNIDIGASPVQYLKAHKNIEAFTAMVNSFELYEALLQDVYEIKNNRIPLHGESAREATDFLSAGFSEELAQNIVETYMQWNPELQKMVIIPCDGIPTISAGEINTITCSQADGNMVVFQRRYDDCYMQGDCYIYSITLKNYPTGWKIEELDLDESN
ncbi:MAG: hypothetical protein ABFD08_08840 [Syntrophomonas sp.]